MIGMAVGGNEAERHRLAFGASVYDPTDPIAK